MNRVLVCAVLAGVVGFSSCKKVGFYTKSDAALEFSESLIAFDTVFTSVNTITRVLRVKNPYKENIKTDIMLVGGATSYFSLNIDGVSLDNAARLLKDVEIPAKDSIFIFIKANINPNGVNNPMLACDTVAFTTNGNRQNVELLACGQDAHFILPKDTIIRVLGKDSFLIICNVVAAKGQSVTWKNDKPYVIYDYAFVDSDAKLTIEKGTRIYLHKGGTLLVWLDGCLEVNGTKDEPVTFQGDRLESWYSNVHGQWDRIWFCESNKDSKIDYAIIKNASFGIHAETLGDLRKNNKLTLTNTVIKNAQIGLLAKTYTIEASNNVFYDCTESCVALMQGGDYAFVNNTIYNRYTRRNLPSLYLSNYFTYNKGIKGKEYTLFSDFSGTFVNNIIYGAFKNEFDCDSEKKAVFSASFENCLLKIDSLNILEKITHTNTLLGKNPAFVEEKDYKNLNLRDTSPCKKAGKPIPWLQTDIEGKARSSAYPSIGAYE